MYRAADTLAAPTQQYSLLVYGCISYLSCYLSLLRSAEQKRSEAQGTSAPYLIQVSPMKSSEKN